MIYFLTGICRPVFLGTLPSDWTVVKVLGKTEGRDPDRNALNGSGPYGCLPARTCLGPGP